MKNSHCILTMAAASALWFACAPFFTASPSFAQPPEKSKAVETREIKIRDGVLVKFEAEKIDAPAGRIIGDGYPIYKGKLYIGACNPPNRILNSGVLEIDGKSVPLDVSSLSDPWVDPKELVPECVRVESG